MPAHGYTHVPPSSVFMPSPAARAQYTNHQRLFQLEKDFLEKQLTERRRLLQRDASSKSYQRPRPKSQSFTENSTAMLEIEYDRAFSKKNRIPLRRPHTRYYSMADRESPSMMHARRIMTKMTTDCPSTSDGITSRGSRRSDGLIFHGTPNLIYTLPTVSSGRSDVGLKAPHFKYETYVGLPSRTTTPKRTVGRGQRKNINYANKEKTSWESHRATARSPMVQGYGAKDTDTDDTHFDKALVVQPVPLRKGTMRRAGLPSALEGNRPIGLNLRQGTFTKDEPEVLKLDPQPSRPTGISSGEYENDTTSESIIFERATDPGNDYELRRTKDVACGPDQKSRGSYTVNNSMTRTNDDRSTQSRKEQLLRKTSKVSFNEDVVVANFYDSKSDDDDDYPDSEHDSLFTPPSETLDDEHLMVNHADGSWSQIVYEGIEQLKYDTPDVSSSLETLTNQPIRHDVTRPRVPRSPPLLRKRTSEKADDNGPSNGPRDSEEVTVDRSLEGIRRANQQNSVVGLDTDVQESIAKLTITGNLESHVHSNSVQSTPETIVTKPKLPLSPFRSKGYPVYGHRKVAARSPASKNSETSSTNEATKKGRKATATETRQGDVRPSVQSMKSLKSQNGDMSSAEALALQRVRAAKLETASHTNME